MSLPLHGLRVAVPESRQLDVLTGLLERRGAEVRRCPLVGIVDAPNEAPIAAWLEWFVATPPDFLVLLTGEGVNRLHGFAETAGISDDALGRAFRQTKIVSRGPKPARALKPFGAQPSYFATVATTAGVIETLRELTLIDRSVGVQLYGDDPNLPLVNFLEREAARVATVSPYRYAKALSDADTIELIHEIAAGSLDVMVFTSMAQVKRLQAVAEANKLSALLWHGLNRCLIAAVGPVVADALTALGIRVDVMPEDRYFMKPLVNALVASRESLCRESSD